MKRLAIFTSVIAMTLASATAFGDDAPTGGETNSAVVTNSTNKPAPAHRSRSGQPSRLAASQTPPAASAAP